MNVYKIAGICILSLIVVSIIYICFDNNPNKYQLYYQLTSKEQNLYTQVENALKSNTDYVTLKDSYNVTEIQNVRDALYYDNPSLYKYDFNDIIYQNNTLKFKQQYTDEQLKDVQTIINNINPDATPDELFDWCVKNIEYIKEDEYTIDNHTILGALCNKRAVCEGIARTYALMLYDKGIPTLLCSTPKHMWNLVYFEGRWHSYDITNNNKNVPFIETCTVSEEGKIFKLPKD